MPARASSPRPTGARSRTERGIGTSMTSHTTPVACELFHRASSCRTAKPSASRPPIDANPSRGRLRRLLQLRREAPVRDRRSAQVQAPPRSVARSGCPRGGHRGGCRRLVLRVPRHRPTDGRHRLGRRVGTPGRWRVDGRLDQHHPGHDVHRVDASTAPGRSTTPSATSTWGPTPSPARSWAIG